MSEQLLTAFFEDLARAMDHWVEAVAQTVEVPQRGGAWTEDLATYERLGDALGGRTDDLRLVLAEAMQGLLHSALTTLDGGTASAEIGRVRLVDDSGEELAEGLHELFVDHLLATGRLR